MLDFFEEDEDVARKFLMLVGAYVLMSECDGAVSRRFFG